MPGNLSNFFKDYERRHRIQDQNQTIKNSSVCLESNYNTDSNTNNIENTKTSCNNNLSVTNSIMTKLNSYLHNESFMDIIN